MNDAPIIHSPDTRRKDRVPPGQTLTEEWPVLQHGDVPPIELSEWRLRIFGQVEKERELTYQEVLALPRVKVFSDIHCVTGWSRLDNLWEGVSTGVLKTLVRIRPGARFAMLHGARGFTTNLSVADFFQEDVLLAVKHNGKMIGPPHGFPLRLVVPRLYFWKSAKWVTGVEFMLEDRLGFWETHGYHPHGDPWKEERYGA
jgi:DMSO/TMAO reductase YedYZ molybdopterin-dependent catalytic subunit